jgi:1-phosphofructokinase family hexose kinase
MILFITPNPAIDVTLVVNGVTLGGVARASSNARNAGGKGVNAARAAHTLRADVFCAGFAGGIDGQRLATLAAQEQLPAHWTQIDGETRSCTIVVDSDTQTATVINEQGPAVSDGDWARLQEDVLRLAQGARHVCFCGSLPLGSPLSAYANLLGALVAQGKQVWVDASGAVLETAVSVAGVNIKVNHEEAATLLNAAILTPRATKDAADALVHRRGARMAIITRGADGATLVTQRGCWHAKPPPIAVVSAVGSGDSSLAGVVTALDQGRSAQEALRWGVAAGSANALSLGGGHFEAAQFHAILADTIVTDCE